MNSSTLNIILPCYNPPDNWVDIIIQSFIKINDSIQDSIQLIIVNDCSTKDLSDGFEQLKNAIPNLQILHLPQNRGKGFALRKGIAHSNASYYIYTDIDFPYTHDSILSIYQNLKKGNDIVAGIKNDEYYQHTPAVRKWISKTLRFFIKKVLRLRIDDTQCGLKGFNNEGRKLFLSTTIDRYLFDLEFIYLSSKNKNITLIPQKVELRPEIVFRKMNLKIIFQEAMNFVRIIFR